MSNNLIKINSRDNVAVVLRDIKENTELKIKNSTVNSTEDIPSGHKIALTDIKKGEPVIKYGAPIGRAVKSIKKGNWVHTHNLKTSLKGKKDYSYTETKKTELKAGKNFAEDQVPVFTGYNREDGQVGIRNEIWIINTVGCITRSSEKIAQKASQKFSGLLKKENIAGIYDFPHPLGCSQLGDDLENTQKILAGLTHHPNAAGVLVVGLGCENNQIEDFKKVIGDYNSDRIKFIRLQDEKNEEKAALDKIKELIDYASQFKKEEISVSRLKIGLKCGGSDSLSGITANPLLGRISDRIISYGGTSILGEVPEMFGAEEILLQRASSRKVFTDIANLINGFKEFFLDNDKEIYENPSPGNIEGGITTLEEKSLGNIEKGGSGLIRGVNKYGDRVKGPGLQLLETPGNDLVSTTALAAAGAHLVLFTTGRGTPFGGPVPTVKISTNSQLAELKENWIDFNAGRLLKDISMEELAQEFFQFLIQIASGKKLTQNEINDFREIAIFKTGVTL
ncbi:MAG: UxaA family hydrolase [Bacillota bacterium]